MQSLKLFFSNIFFYFVLVFVALIMVFRERERERENEILNLIYYHSQRGHKEVMADGWFNVTIWQRQWIKCYEERKWEKICHKRKSNLQYIS